MNRSVFSFCSCSLRFSFADLCCDYLNHPSSIFFVASFQRVGLSHVLSLQRCELLLDSFVGWLPLWLQFWLSSVRLRFVIYLSLFRLLSLSVTAPFCLSVASLPVDGNIITIMGTYEDGCTSVPSCDVSACWYGGLVESISSVECAGPDLSDSFYQSTSSLLLLSIWTLSA